ncbi:hypothetical protein PVK06_041995 [Gossypium arboreum]|uniref:Uncharacterized protein n=1 Tax=Gossypium arboreum TaxID=29729 RepID=A0ABR0NA20_GOSAR|nr:hypothetical protein PVK06_041995 [Gossypium arboreum]
MKFATLDIVPSLDIDCHLPFYFGDISSIKVKNWLLLNFPSSLQKSSFQIVHNSRSRVMSTERTILSPFTKEYRVLVTLSGIRQLLEGYSLLNAPIPVLVLKGGLPALRASNLLLPATDSIILHYHSIKADIPWEWDYNKIADCVVRMTFDTKHSLKVFTEISREVLAISVVVQAKR